MAAAKKDNFNFWLPLAFEKSKYEAYPRGDERRYENMVFEGIASDSSVDYEGDSMEPNGFDITYFLSHGLFNLDHLTSRAKELKSRFWIGEPIDGKIVDNKFWVKGRLWKESPEARAFWDKCIEMKESGSSRRPGMSIEGRALERDPDNEKHITRAIINNIALTLTPVNFNTYFDIVKGIQKEDFIPTGSGCSDISCNGLIFYKKVGSSLITIDTNYNFHHRKL